MPKCLKVRTMLCCKNPTQLGGIGQYAKTLVDYEISKWGSLLQGDMAKDRELLKKLLDNLKEFEAETTKKMSDQRSRRPPP